MKNKYLCLLFLLFSLVSMSAHAQIKVEGNVFDENDTPLIGVSVVAEGGTNGAITDLNGHFSLMVSNANSHLTFSYVGYITQKVQLKGKKLLKIILREDANLLDEVVVVGYGTQKKINVTGAIAQVDNKELKMAPSGSLSGMLAGRLPGLISKQSSGQPGADGANLYIRGNGAGDGSPLIVIDGVITDYFPSFSPDEVESITILKDATAAAVYGVRAAAGVILITTKRGAVQKPTVTYNGSLTLSQNTDFPKFLNGPDYAYWYNKAQLLDGVAEENLRFSPEEIDRITNPGEKVVIFSPFYENYGADTILSGAEPIYVPLVPPEFHFDKEKLEDAFRQGAKALILCNPSNPCGKVFTMEEMQTIAELAKKYDAYVVTDEVYEHIVYAPNKHIYMQALEGMRERTIVCNSLSKTYSITGWRLGYVIANPQIIDRVKKVHDFLTVGAAAPLMEAAVVGLEFGDGYYDELAAHYAHMKEVFVGGLKKLGLKYTDPQGAYYVLVDVSEFGVKDDVKFCEWMAQYVGVAAVPGSSFFREDVHNLVRFHFAKQDDTLNEAIKRLATLKEKAMNAKNVDWR